MEKRHTKIPLHCKQCPCFLIPVKQKPNTNSQQEYKVPTLWQQRIAVKDGGKELAHCSILVERTLFPSAIPGWKLDWSGRIKPKSSSPNPLSAFTLKSKFLLLKGRPNGYGRSYATLTTNHTGSSERLLRCALSNTAARPPSKKTVQGSMGSTERRPVTLLIHFFHAGCVLITFQWRDIFRNSSTGLLSSYFILINA